ncbi:rab11 family-interacting protein 2 [Agrilus planipennis]|uniref:Rab11 family-interacting protein 2 n=1 Tax=Agrilus planipennis TaxID=224129 RepID=A0A1W4X426_AGRPL|nr:rab11 family-interacting protein 2 [Agrilus planipennis]
MWMPTHVQVVVHRATGLLTKGKNNTNDCFVTIALGKTKYQTSIKEKAFSVVEWHEECELPIPDQGNRAEIVLTVLHRNFLGVDEFLGRVAVPLNELDVYERPKGRWYMLQSKPGQESKGKARGQLEVKIAFIVKAGSLTDLSKKEKHKSSIFPLSQVAQSVGGSLLSIGSLEKRKGIKKIAKSIGSKMHLKGKKKAADDESSSMGSVVSLQQNAVPFKSKQTREDADPGVVSEDEDEFAFDELSHKSSSGSLNYLHNRSVANGSLENLPGHENIQKNGNTKSEQQIKDEWELKLGLTKQNKNSKLTTSESFNKLWDSPKFSPRIEEEDEKITTAAFTEEVPKKEEKETMLTKFKNIMKDKDEVKNVKLSHSSDERIIIGGENDSRATVTNTRISAELLQKFDGRNREDLILIINELQSELEHQKRKNKDLEDYLDELLLKVMETTPRILQNPYADCRMAHTQVK